MKNHQNKTRYLVVWMALLVVFGTSGVLAQLDPDVAKFGYADTIFINGKVVSPPSTSPRTTGRRRSMASEHRWAAPARSSSRPGTCA